MPFIKRAPTTPTADADAEGLASDVVALSSHDDEVRWRAARALGGRAEFVAQLAAALSVEQVPRVREAMMTALMRVGDAASIETLLPYLRSQDAGLRATALEALQALPEAVLPFLPTLLADNDSDVRVLATELARNMPAPGATRILCELIENEEHPNVCAAAIEVLAEVGTREALPALKLCAERFSNTPFVSFAVSVAIARIATGS
jgi:HEAT repeat protein